MSLLNKLPFHRFTVSKRPSSTIFLIFAFCILTTSLTFFIISIGKPYIGVMLSMNKEGWAVAMVDTTGLGNQAGIVVGDRPVMINGQPADTFLEKYRETGTALGRSIRSLTVIDDQGQLKSVTLEGSPQNIEAIIEVAALLSLCIVFWIIGFYVLFKRSRNIAALLLCLCSLSLGLALGGGAAAQRAIPTAVHFEIIATIIGPWLLLHFLLFLPEERPWLRNNPLVYLVYLPAVITMLLYPLIGYADDQPVLWFRTFRLFEYGAGFLASAVVVVYNYFRSTSFRTKQQMKIVLLSCLAALIPLVFLNIIPQAMWEQTILPPGFSFLFFAFIPLGMGYAVVTQRLMDIDVVIRRSVIYGLITLFMAVILSAAILPAFIFRESINVPGEIAIALGLAIIATILFGPVKSGIETLVDRLFYKDRYDYRQIIESLSTSLKSLNEFTEISRVIVGTAVHTLNLAGGCLFTRSQSGSLQVSTSQGIFTDPHEQNELTALISQQSSEVEFPNSASALFPKLAFLIPLIAGEKEVGILCLGSKNSRQDFSADDMYLLQELASISAMALHSATLIRDVSARDTFVSIASHELRTPLTSIMGYAELIMRRNPPDDVRKRWAQNIYNGSQQISEMVDDLLNVSRIQTGRATIKLDRVKLPDILDEVLSMAKESSNKHEFFVNIQSGLPDVLVDHDKFAQVIGNLLSNAVKYSPDGGQITLSAHDDPQRQRAVVSVADEGIGISNEDMASLFTTFHRIQRPETQGVRGSGLGLYIAKEWTEAMGGEIWLESELNKGSTFFVSVLTRASETRD